MNNKIRNTRKAKIIANRRRRQRKVFLTRVIMATLMIVGILFLIGTLFVKSLYVLGIAKGPFEERFEKVQVYVSPSETVYDVLTELVPNMSSDDYRELIWHFEQENDVKDMGNLKPGTYTFFEPIKE